MTKMTKEEEAIVSMTKDMEVIDDFLIDRGRYVGDMVHVSIADLAAKIRALKPYPTDDNMMSQTIEADADTGFITISATYTPERIKIPIKDGLYCPAGSIVQGANDIPLYAEIPLDAIYEALALLKNKPEPIEGLREAMDNDVYERSNSFWNSSKNRAAYRAAARLALELTEGE